MANSNNEHGYIHFSQYFQSPLGNSKAEAGTVIRWGQLFGWFAVFTAGSGVVAMAWGAITGQAAKVHDLASATSPVVLLSNFGASANAAARQFNNAVITPTNQAIQSGQFTPIPTSPSDPSQITAPPTNAPR